MGVVSRCFEVVSADSDRVTATIRIDWRRGRSGRLQSKLDSVERTLGRKLRT
jgi:uncharacterized protein YqgV (UPF0045/DUF77 family)